MTASPEMTFPLVCPVCREGLPERGNRRVRIPWRGGKLMLVHADCAPLVAAQGVLDGAEEAA